jgi:HTH-type transcriptional regulator/antitoxin HigA
MLNPRDLTAVPKVLADCGLRFVIVEGLSGAKIDGVCFWLDASRPVVGMSLRHDRIDNFWFVLWHELAHVMNNDGKEYPIIDVELEGERASGSDSAQVSAQERRANLYAAEKCVPAGDMLTFTARKNEFPSGNALSAVGFGPRLAVHRRFGPHS